MPLAHVDGIDLNYRIDGGDGMPLLVLSNGLGLDLTMWTPQIRELSKKFRVLRYDAPGHGGSSASAAPVSIDRLGRDVLALLDIAGDTQMHFCGLSMGGMIGMWLGIHAPHRLTRMVLAHTAARIGPVSMWNERIELVEASGMKAISGAAMTRWFTPGFIAAQPATVALLKDVMERCSAAGYAHCCAAVRDADFRSAIAAISTPALIVSGSQDVATTPADARFLAEQIAHSQTLEFDAAHLSNIEKSHVFTEALCAFFDAEPAPSPLKFRAGSLA